MHDLPAPDLRVLQQQYVLSHIAQLRKRIEQPLDDERAGHAVSHLLIGAAVGMRVVPIQSRWVGGKDADLVVLRAAGRDVQEDVVGGTERRDSQPVHVEVRGLVERIAEPQPDHVARLHA